jgi:tRNA pseudouridine38-40 synthase
LNEGGLIIIEIEADGFLYNMVRNIVGTLLEIGRGRLLGGSLKSILLARDRRLAGPTVPACGLYLARIKY